MGLFGGKRMKDGVEQTATIRWMAPTEKAARQTGKLDVDYRLRLATPGGEVEITCKVPHDRMPAQGQDVPVRISAGDPTWVEVIWDRVPAVADRARASAAAAQRGDTAGAAEALGFKLRDP